MFARPRQEVENLLRKVGEKYGKQLITSARIHEQMDALENRSRRNFLVIRLIKIGTIIRERAEYIMNVLTTELGKLKHINKASVVVKSSSSFQLVEKTDAYRT